jgi:hypothetical protein
MDINQIKQIIGLFNPTAPILSAGTFLWKAIKKTQIIKEMNSSIVAALTPREDQSYLSIPSTSLHAASNRFF